MYRISKILLLFTFIGLIPPLYPIKAFAIDKIYSPIVEEGEVEIEARGVSEFHDDGEDKHIQKFGVGYAPSDRFAFEFYAETEHEESETELEAIAVETRYQLTEQGEYWLDAGAYLEFEYAFDEEYKIETKALLEKEVGKTLHTTNLILERDIFNHGGMFEAGLAWKSKYRLDEAFEPGFEYFAEFGRVNDIPTWDEQEHAVGPAVYGKLWGKVKYGLALVFGVSDAAPDQAVRWEIEFEL
ncbi:MAG: hypothetical protein KDD56_05890 [Bdellovibrionales bacterium]|nr:hypothetical protein [Bdellovibrionales bacterium]